MSTILYQEESFEVFDDPIRFLPAPLGIDVLHGSQLDPGDVLGSFHHLLLESMLNFLRLWMSKSCCLTVFEIVLP